MARLCLLVLGLTLALSSSASGAEGVEIELRGGSVTDLQAWLAIFTLSGLAALLTLTALETVLGIDNVVFISVLAAKLPAADRPRTRRLGLTIAMVMRVLLLLVVGWLMRLTSNLFQIPYLNADQGLSGKDLILIVGGGFLLFKAVKEIHHKVESGQTIDEPSHLRKAASVSAVLVQVALIDLVFSLDSVITAVGMTQNIPVMIVAVITSVAVMMVAAEPIARFVEDHPAVKILALAFLVLIGVLLVAEGLGQHLDKGYIYFAMAFALLVELLQIRMGRPRKA
ncbi:MAG: TerC family protein [Myxococcales bacterium]|nr:TerC family protein [Myxococcales bacterium]